MKLRKTRHSVYNINYHFVWIPKYRRSILNGQIKADLEGLIKSYALKNGVEILSLSIQQDHVHLFVSSPPRFSPSQLINLFKGATARELLKRYPNLKRRGSLWTRSYYVGTAGTVSSETIRHYIDECQEP
ncbi:MAG: IS200/IS605 family transposase [Candidatus Poribacteria bacterium]|nr:IS200/IS605 family transposase [Candidatus Poribacteria bacterium]